jgi:hypothetical protein
MVEDIEKNFSIYNKTASDYWVVTNDKIVPTQTLILTQEETDFVVEINDEAKYQVYKQDFIDRLSPDKINSCVFWKIATDKFPFFSIAGGIQKIYTIDEVNTCSNNMSNMLGCIDVLNEIFDKNRKAKMLEIGPGHGNIKNLLVNHGLDTNYHAIDVNPLFEFPRIYQTDGKHIPDTIPNNMDLVYSVNVFQHLSKAQRTSYYKQIFEVLKDGGVFVFGMFVVTEENKNWPVWGARDENGNIYTHFFRQFTKIDHLDDIMVELSYLGYSKIEMINPIADKTHYLTFKVTK